MEQEPISLNKRQMQIALWMLHEGMSEIEIMAAKLRAIEVIAAHDALNIPAESLT